MPDQRPTPRPRKATLRDVARTAEVSVATVSRVLNSSALVTADTRERVVAAIEALQFVPSGAARALSTGRSRTIGALVPTLDHAIYARFLAAIESGLSARSFSLVVSITGGDPRVEVDKAAALLDLGVEGLIVSGLQRSSDFHDLIERSGLPILATSVYDPDARYPTVGYDNRAMAAQALHHLVGLGHRNIGIVHGDPSQNDRVAGRLSGLDAPHGVHLHYHQTEISVSGGVGGATALLEKVRPTAILCLSDVLALGVMFELQRRKHRVPEDVALMGFDNLEWAAHSTPALTAVNLPAKRMGLAAADAICDWADGRRIAQPQLVPGELIVRGSTDPQAAAGTGEETRAALAKKIR